MEITLELLGKYKNNTCSPEERAAVEKWLSETAAEVPEISDAEWKESGTLMWTAIAAGMQQEKTHTVPLYRKLIPYASAACLLLTLSLAAYIIAARSSKPHAQLALTESNTATHAQASDLFPQNNTDVASMLSKTEMTIRCDRMQIITADVSRDTEISTVCNGQRVSRTVSLKKGNRYILYTDNNKVMLLDYKTLGLMSPYEKKHIMHQIMKLKVS